MIHHVCVFPIGTLKKMKPNDETPHEAWAWEPGPRPVTKGLDPQSAIGDQKNKNTKNTKIAKLTRPGPGPGSLGMGFGLSLGAWPWGTGLAWA